jgi:hypothetical protein
LPLVLAFALNNRQDLPLNPELDTVTKFIIPFNVIDFDDVTGFTGALALNITLDL